MFFICNSQFSFLDPEPTLLRDSVTRFFDLSFSSAESVWATELLGIIIFSSFFVLTIFTNLSISRGNKHCKRQNRFKRVCFCFLVMRIRIPLESGLEILFRNRIRHYCRPKEKDDQKTLFEVF